MRVGVARSIIVQGIRRKVSWLIHIGESVVQVDSRTAVVRWQRFAATVFISCDFFVGTCSYVGAIIGAGAVGIQYIITNGRHCHHDKRGVGKHVYHIIATATSSAYT